MCERELFPPHFALWSLDDLPLANQVVPQTVRTGGVARGRSAMIINLSAQSAGTAYDVHPLALWILCAAFEHIRGTAKPDKALSYYHENNACASFGSYGTGTPLSRAFYAARRCMYDTRSGCGGFRDADLPAHDGWSGKGGGML